MMNSPRLWMLCNSLLCGQLDLQCCSLFKSSRLALDASQLVGRFGSRSLKQFLVYSFFCMGFGLDRNKEAFMAYKFSAISAGIW